MYFVFYDLETTGLNIGSDKTVEIAAYHSLSKKSFSSFINPGMSIPPEATRIHGITDNMVVGYPEFNVIFPQFVEFCGEQAIMVAHNNNRFDQPFMQAEAASHSIVLPPWQYIDSLLWARKYRKDLPNHALQNLRQFYSIPPLQEHRALDDVFILAMIFEKMTKGLSPEQVLSLAHQEGEFRMPFGKYQGKRLEDVPESYLKWLEKKGALEDPQNSKIKEHLLSLRK